MPANETKTNMKSLYKEIRNEIHNTNCIDEIDYLIRVIIRNEISNSLSYEEEIRLMEREQYEKTIS
jgi:hypothetical protein